MKHDTMFNIPQPPIIWKLTTTALIAISMFIFISHNYHINLYIIAFLSFIVGIVDMVFKSMEVHTSRMNKRKVIWFNREFLSESGLLSLCIAAACLGWGLSVKGYEILTFLMTFPILIGYLFMAIVEVRTLVIVLMSKTVEDPK